MLAAAPAPAAPALDAFTLASAMWGSGPADPALAPLLQQQARNLDVARDLLAEIADPSSPDALDRAVALARIGSRGQAETLGLDLAAVRLPASPHAGPAEAVLALAERHARAITGEEHARVLALDDLAEPVRGALLQVLNAFLVLESASRTAFAAADAEKLAHLEQLAASSPHEATPHAFPGWNPLAWAGVDLAPMLVARDRLLDATLALDRALAAAPPPEVQACEPLVIAPALAIDLATCDHTYTASVALSIDAGGNDRYYNNAGGSNLLGGCSPNLDSGGVGALLDHGAGTDAYGNPTAPRRCGVNGGSYLGAGFLVDGGGDDTYTGRERAVNGGGNVGVGFLVDAGGNDRYTGTNGAVNGGGWLGLGLLVDAGGNDAYTGREIGVNGGGATGGVGFLVDAGGNDAYTGRHSGVNGGGSGGVVTSVVVAPAGVGFLLDASGRDTYSDLEGGSGVDRTVAPKGTVGAQVDAALPFPPA